MSKYSCFKWHGGKSYMKEDLLPFPIHEKFLEVFGGGAVILLNKVPCKMEYYNDINSRLVKFWKVLQKEYLYFTHRIELEIESREIFKQYKIESKNLLEDAFRFFYVNRHSFSGNNVDFTGIKPNPHSSGIPVMRSKIEDLPKIHNRIKDVVFENQDYQTILKRFLKQDSEDLLIYADPPYETGGHIYEKSNGYSWTKEDFKKLTDLLLQFKKSKIIVSIDLPDFLPWRFTKIEKKNKVQQNPNSSTRIEYIYYNFEESIPRMKAKNIRTLGSFMKI